MMKNLQRNWLVSKLIWEFWKFLTRALESLKTFTLMGSFWAKYTLFELKKYRGVIFHDTEEWWKIWRKLTRSLENDRRNLVNFHQSTWKSQNRDFDGILSSKAENVWASNLQRSYVSWQWRMMQIWRGIDSWLQNWHEEFDEFWLEHSKVS